MERKRRLEVSAAALYFGYRSSRVRLGVDQGHFLTLPDLESGPTRPNPICLTLVLFIFILMFIVLSVSTNPRLANSS